MSKSKYVIDTDSDEYDSGYANFMCGRDPYYYSRKEYQKYKNHNAGYNKAKEDVDTFGKDIAYNIWRLTKLLLAIGKPEQIARNILTLPDGNVLRHEIDAVMIKLFSASSEAYNNGRDAFLEGKKDTDCPYSKAIDYANYTNWKTGFQSTELAVRLHGKQAVTQILRHYKR